MSKSKFDILQANSKLFYAYICSYHFIFCANEGATKNNSQTLFVIAFSPHVPSRPSSGVFYKFIS